MIVDAIMQNTDTLFMGTTVLCSLAGLYLVKTTKALKESRSYLTQVIDSLQEGFYTSSLDGKQLSANPALVRLNGYKSEAELLAAVGDIAKEWYVDPDRREKFRDLLFRHGKVTNFVSEVYRHHTRERIWISENARLVHDPVTLEPLHYEGTVREITDEIRRRDSEERLNKLADNLPGGLFQVHRTADGKFTAPYLSQSFLRLCKTDLAHASGSPNSYLKYIHHEDLPDYLAAFELSAKKLSPINVQFRYHASAERLIWLHTTATPEALNDDEIVWHGHVMDITERKEVEKKIERMAYFDTLTGLPKRTVMQENLNATIALCNRRRDHAALLFLDLDDFKTLNDSFGHEFGDDLLRQVAKRLQGPIRASDTVCRFGGDEFIILIDGLGNDPAEAALNAKLFAEKILSLFDKEFTLGDFSQKVRTSIGVALIDTSKPKAEEIIRRADGAMYQAKQRGRNTYVLYGDDHSAAGANMAVLRDGISTAIEDNQFEVYYQPQFSAHGELTGAEAFIRWRHPQLGLLAPSEFLAIAESSREMAKIDNFVLKTATEQLRKWQLQEQTRDLSLAINVNIQQFSSPNFISELMKALETTGINPASLTLEINEKIINRGVENVRRQMLDIAKTGIRFSFDDFGTGNSSLSCLSRLPFDEVKIDGAFISSIGKQGDQPGLVEGILKMASAMGLETVAEHVTTRTQEAYLRERGCNRMQGFYYSQPLPLDEFEQLVAQEKHAFKAAHG